MKRRVRRRLIASGMLGLMLWASVSEAQFGAVVHDPIAYVRHVITSISTAQMLQRQIQDLSLLADFRDYAQTLATALAFAQAASQLSTRLLSRYSRWTAMIPNGVNIPCTIDLLRRWSVVYDADTEQSVFDGGVAQTLIGSAATILGDLSSALDIARGIAGTVSGLQSLHTLIAKLVTLITGTQTMRAPMDEKESRKDMRQLVHRKASEVLKENRLAGIEGRPRTTCELMPGI